MPALDATMDATLIVDEADVVVEANDSAVALTAREPHALIGVPLATLVGGLELAEATEEDTSARVDGTLLLPSGALAVHAWRRRLSPTRVAVILRDATEWLTAQSTLALIVAGVESSVDSFAITDELGNVEYVNQAHTIAVGRSLFEVMGEPVTRFIDGDDAAVVDAALRAGVPWHGEVICRRPNGERRHHDLTLTPVRDTLTGLRRFVCIRRDISERFLAEAKAEALREQLVHADRLGVLGQLAASVAHDVNNPASFILSNLQLAIEELVAWQADGAGDRNVVARRTAALIEMLGDALDGTERVIALVRGMRSLGVRGAALQEHVSLAEIARDALRLTRAQTGACAKVIERLSVPAVVDGDRLRLGQVAVNLLVNAAQAIPPGSPEAHVIAVETREGEGFAELSVSDSGVGIPADHLERVFEAWFTTKNREEGTGLGLAVSRQILTDLGGTLVASQGPERGTVFTLRLPRRALAT